MQPLSTRGASEGAISRRAFLRGLGTAAVTAAAAGTQSVAAELEQANGEQVVGPDKIPVQFTLNGAIARIEVEPRVTLLDALRNHLGVTGPKEACDRASCGACTVLLDGEPVYACSLLAIEAAGAEITTVEGLASDGELTALQHSLIEKDGMQCGFCTPGFAVTLTAFLRDHPQPTEAEIRKACAGNLCRCGTYPRVFAAALAAAGVKTSSNVEILHPHDHGLA